MSGIGSAQDSSIRWADELDDSDSGIEPPMDYKPLYSQESTTDYRQTSAKAPEETAKSFEGHRADFLAGDPSDTCDLFSRRNLRSNNKKGTNSRKPRTFTPPHDDEFSWRSSSNSLRGGGRNVSSMGSKSEGT
uniref:Uncharacterized protein n=1 Tax=Babesia bovis TaxID=5865 RepID=A7AS10_BABBO|nr:hypothetical protein [Babesia bovis]|eukprot:XP_001610897.1 hypothetical protein [Babesia bovis T2Bo]